MDKTFQDIHICNRLTGKETVYRAVRIQRIEFSDTMMIISYEDDINIVTLGVPKQRYVAVTID